MTDLKVRVRTLGLPALSQIQRSPGQLAVIEAGSAIELGDDRWKLDSKSPLVGPASRSDERLPPGIPPAGDESGEWLHHKHAVAVLRPLEEPVEQQLPAAVVQFVQRERCEHERRRSREPGRCGIGADRAGAEAKVAVCVRGFGERPRMAIDTEDLRLPFAGAGPGGSSRTGAAAQVDKLCRSDRCARQLTNDPIDQQVMDRTVKKRKGRALPCAGERRAFTQPIPPFDVSGR